ASVYDWFGRCRFDCALARLFWALASAFSRSVASMRASSWPVVTCWPTVTDIAERRPALRKLRRACPAGLTEPEIATVCARLALAASAVRYVTAGVPVLPRRT